MYKRARNSLERASGLFSYVEEGIRALLLFVYFSVATAIALTASRSLSKSTARGALPNVLSAGTFVKVESSIISFESHLNQ